MNKKVIWQKLPLNDKAGRRRRNTKSALSDYLNINRELLERNHLKSYHRVYRPVLQPLLFGIGKSFKTQWKFLFLSSIFGF